jgi:hypothetical protein
MLEPQDRRMLLDVLRPPPGCELDFALGTTYSLDLLAMLTAPLGFTLYSMDDAPERALESGDALLLLQTLRRYANRIGIFCQAGRIAEPRGKHPLFSLLEGSVLEVGAPTPGGVFHPKVWVLRFVGDDEAVSYRVLCLSRNLTFDKSWDTALVLDGPLVERKVGYARNHPLADFVAVLPSLCIHQPVPDRVRDAAECAADELRRVDFELPPGIEGMRFWPLGLPGRRMDPFADARVDRLMVVSPFLTASKVQELGSWGTPNVLVSRHDTLRQLSAKQLDGWNEVYALSTTANVEDEAAAEVASEEAPASRGLHAKLYVADAGWDASIFTGSANATAAAFGRNVEFLVELTGRRSVCGIDALLSRSDGTVALRDLLEEFMPLDSPELEDETVEALEALLEEARALIAGWRWRVLLQDAQGGTFAMRVRAGDADQPALPPDVRVRCWPITLPEAAGRPLARRSPELDFGTVSFESITSFVAVEVTAAAEGQEASTRFVVNASLDGAPSGRMERLLQYLLRDRRQVLRFLLLLLSPDDDSAAFGPPVGGLPLPGAAGVAMGAESEALLEPLLRALDRDPTRLDHVHTVIEDLAKSADGRRLLPEGLDAVWGPIWAARRSLAE